LRHLLGITKLDKEKNQCIREKTGAQNIVKGIKQYRKKWLQQVQRVDRNRMYRGWTEIECTGGGQK
jgi:RNase adaptor protein for sRNA GlmZ degradation